MSQKSTVHATTGTLRVPGARLHYEVRGAGPLVVLVGAPMHAASFAPLADRLAANHTVLTTDPRGINRSPVDDPELDSTPEMRADDISRLIRHLDLGPAAVLGSSGGAVSALALGQSDSDHIHTVVAHEPPLVELLDDRDRLRALQEDVIATHSSGDVAGAGRKFLAMADITLPEPVFQQMFSGERSPQEAADDDFQHRRMLRQTTRWFPHVAALRSGRARIVIGVGETSAGQLAERTSRALAAALGVTPTMFPGGHVGFLEDPDRFAARLRAVLASEGASR